MSSRKSQKEAAKPHESGTRIVIEPDSAYSPASNRLTVAAEPDAEPTSILDRTRATMDRACSSLDGCVTRVASMLTDGEYDKDLASHLAWLTKQLAGVTDALRKLEAHDKTIVAKMSPEKRDELVMAYLKALTPARQRSIAVQLEQWSRPGGMLG